MTFGKHLFGSGIRRLIAGTATLLRKRSGVIAIEFAVVGSVFLLLVLFAMNIGLQQFRQSTMDAATQMAARQMQIGTTRDPVGVTSLICKQLSIVAPDCGTSTLQLYAVSGSSFTPMVWVSSPNTGIPPSSSFLPGASLSYVLLQVAYKTSPIVPFPGYTNSYLISTVAFENEP